MSRMPAASRISNAGTTAPSGSGTVAATGDPSLGYSVQYFLSTGADITADVEAGTFTTPSLDPGKTYIATVFKDAPDATYLSAARNHIAYETIRVRKGDTYKLWLAPGGGG